MPHASPNGSGRPAQIAGGRWGGGIRGRRLAARMAVTPGLDAVRLPVVILEDRMKTMQADHKADIGPESTQVPIPP